MPKNKDSRQQEEELKQRLKECIAAKETLVDHTVFRLLQDLQRKRLGFTVELLNNGGGHLGWINPDTGETVYI